MAGEQTHTYAAVLHVKGGCEAEARFEYQRAMDELVAGGGSVVGWLNVGRSGAGSDDDESREVDTWSIADRVAELAKDLREAKWDLAAEHGIDELLVDATVQNMEFLERRLRREGRS